MKLFKIALVILVLVLAAVGAFSLLGIILASLKYIVGLALVLLVGAAGYKLLTRKRSQARLNEAFWPDNELEESRRILEAINRGELSK